jgi:dUTP pyrophosphatase
MIQNIGIKLLDPLATVPTKTNHNDAGWDLYATNNTVIWPQQRAVVHTGISIQMPDNLAGLIWPRSGLSVKKGIDVLAGVIDAGYRGEILVCLYNTDVNAVEINRGDRIAQIIFQEVPNVNLNVLESLDSSQRGEHGFGSSGL